MNCCTRLNAQEYFILHGNFACNCFFIRIKRRRDETGCIGLLKMSENMIFEQLFRILPFYCEILA